MCNKWAEFSTRHFSPSQYISFIILRKLLDPEFTDPVISTHTHPLDSGSSGRWMREDWGTKSKLSINYSCAPNYRIWVYIFYQTLESVFLTVQPNCFMVPLVYEKTDSLVNIYWSFAGLRLWKLLLRLHAWTTTLLNSSTSCLNSSFPRTEKSTPLLALFM